MAQLSKPEIKAIADAVATVMATYEESVNATDKPNPRIPSPQSFLIEPSRKALMDVPKIISDPSLTPQKAHAEWVKNRQSLGWVHKIPLNREKKHHPLLLPYEKIQKKYKVWDALYFSLVRSMASLAVAFHQTPAEAPTAPSNGYHVPSPPEDIHASRVGKDMGSGEGYRREDFSNVSRPTRR